MINKFNSNFTIKGRINNPYFNTSFAKNTSALIDETPSNSFKDVIGNIAGSIDKDLNAPDKLMNDVINGSGNVDVHDVTTAMAKAEMTVTLATQVTSKVISAYERISQISV